MTKVSVVQALIQSARRRGILKSLSLVPKNLVHEARWYLDQAFDREHGTDTSEIIELQDLRIHSRNAALGNRYDPSSTRQFRSVMKQLPIRHEDFAFVDLGSGKGRTLLLAAEYPFRKIVGVEFSSELNAVAVRNIGIYRSPRQRCADIASLHMDAADYALPPENLVIYLYNPFQREVVLRVLENLRYALAERSREVLIVYFHPVNDDLLKQQEFLLFKAELRLPYDWTRNMQKKLFVYSSHPLLRRA